MPYLNFVEGRKFPRIIQPDLESATTEALRLQNIEQNKDRKIYVLEIVNVISPQIPRTKPVKKALITIEEQRKRKANLVAEQRKINKEKLSKPKPKVTVKPVVQSEKSDQPIVTAIFYKNKKVGLLKTENKPE